MVLSFLLKNNPDRNIQGAGFAGMTNLLLVVTRLIVISYELVLWERWPSWAEGA